VPKGITLSNGGDITIYDPVITVLVTSGTMTQLDIDGIDDAIDITWTGSISVGTTLQIDCAPQTVTNLSGTDQYSGFVLNSGHTVRGWLPINPGITPLLFTVTGAGANISVTHYDQFR
jgi:phage-related protein